ncbi:MAG: SDR family oxidoreductase [Lachnospiraceae bacterium]|nr:SDR family oxidoreductase [Lachnospiraceae bacterium]MBP3610644.1 SDR family oxidoreductase [Lachnospiraceae bacterium]
MKQYAVITGASAGLGTEFARQLAAKGYKLILTARREDRLKQLAEELGTECEIIPADLSSTEECLRFFEAVRDKKIDIFINNAGFGDCSLFLKGDLDKELSMVDVNVKAVHTLFKLMLQKLQNENRGYILNVASSAGLLPAGPYMATYYATKAYVTSLTQAVAQELKEQKSAVYVGVLCPGPVDTEFNEVANVEFALPGITPEYCVRYALHQMAERRTVIVPTLLMKLSTTLGRISPRKLSVMITSGQQRRKLGKR